MKWRAESILYFKKPENSLYFVLIFKFQTCTMITDILLLLLGFLLLLKGADWLVKGSASIALKLGVSELVIGLTIVAFGTSMPELVVSTIGAVKNLNQMVLGNVLGSNIFNILVILGVTALVRPVSVSLSTIKREIPYSILAGAILFIMANDSFFAPDPRYHQQV